MQADLYERFWVCCSCRKVFRVVKDPPVLCTVIGSYCSLCRDSLEEPEIEVDKSEETRYNEDAGN